MLQLCYTCVTLYLSLLEEVDASLSHLLDLPLCRQTLNISLSFSVLDLHYALPEGGNINSFMNRTCTKLLVGLLDGDWGPHLVPNICITL